MSKINMLSPKPVVNYDKTRSHYIREGYSALVYPLNHPDVENVSNNKEACTSAVKQYDPLTGVFETENTMYVGIVPPKVDQHRPAGEIEDYNWIN